MNRNLVLQQRNMRLPTPPDLNGDMMVIAMRKMSLILITIQSFHCSEMPLKNMKDLSEQKGRNNKDPWLKVIHRKLTSSLDNSWSNAPVEELSKHGLYPEVRKVRDTMHKPFPCTIHSEKNNVIVNCSTRFIDDSNLLSLDFFQNTTRLLLNENSLTVIPNAIFSILVNLRKLDLSRNKINRLQPGAFEGLSNLVSLNLEYNQLKFNNDSYPDPVFVPLKKLKELRLLHNTDNDEVDFYPPNVFGHLKSLQCLTIDTVGENFHFQKQFSGLESLISAEITGTTYSITNETFEHVRNVSLLSLDDLPYLSRFNNMAFQNMPNLDVLSLNNIPISSVTAFQLLKPLADRDRNMTAINFRKLGLSDTELYTDLSHGYLVIDSHKTVYLRNICVSHFSFQHSNIMIVKEGAFMSPKLRYCLISVDLSNNMIIGTRTALYDVVSLKAIEFISFQDSSRFQMTEKNKYSTENDNLQIETSTLLRLSTYRNRKSILEYDEDVDLSISLYEKPQEMEDTYEAGEIKNMSNYQPFTTHCFQIFLPDTLRVINLANIVKSNPASHNFCITAKRLTYLDLSNSGFHDFTGQITGTESIRTLILSGSLMSVLSESFFDSSIGIQELDISNCMLNVDTMASNSSRIFMNLRSLKRLDISLNSLMILEVGTFSANRQLMQLKMAGNRFKNVPFDLTNTPNLNLLDLRDNSIITLDQKTRQKLDNLAEKSGGLRLFLEGNLLSCACDSIPFLYWLQTTNIQLDRGGNFTCINDEGKQAYTSDYSELIILWRRCWGGLFLALSIGIFSMIIVGFLSTFIIWKNNMFIKNTLKRLIEQSTLKGPKDYAIGVFIAYAESDHRFPCFILSKFVQDKLHLSTYIYHRDLLGGSDIPSSIVDVIHSSWRIVLVVTENFLTGDRWSMFTCKSAMYCQTSENPTRVVVLVEERLQHLLPTELLRAIHEDNIMIVPAWEITYDLREKLKTRLLPV